MSVRAFRFVFCLHYLINAQQDDYEINASIYLNNNFNLNNLPVHIYYLSLTRTSLRKYYCNSDNTVKLVSSLIVYVLYFHFLPNKE